MKYKIRTAVYYEDTVEADSKRAATKGWLGRQKLMGLDARFVESNNNYVKTKVVRTVEVKEAMNERSSPPV